MDAPFSFSEVFAVELFSLEARGRAARLADLRRALQKNPALAGELVPADPLWAAFGLAETQGWVTWEEVEQAARIAGQAWAQWRNDPASEAALAAADRAAGEYYQLAHRFLFVAPDVQFHLAEAAAAAATRMQSEIRLAQGLPEPRGADEAKEEDEEEDETAEEVLAQIPQFEQEARAELTAWYRGLAPPADEPQEAAEQPDPFAAELRFLDARVALLHAEARLLAFAARRLLAESGQWREALLAAIAELQRSLAHYYRREGESYAASRPNAPPPRPDNTLDLTRLDVLNRDLCGLAFSGGGIRSATFALGVLQGLARLRLVGMFDYLSTVSGGGYIGGWLAAWMRREDDPANVELQLDPSRISQSQARRGLLEADPADPAAGSRVVDPEPEPIRHLREHSRYLAPHIGFSLDSLALVGTYLRNVSINLMLFLPLALVAIFALHAFLACFAAPGYAESIAAGNGGHFTGGPFASASWIVPLLQGTLAVVFGLALAAGLAGFFLFRGAPLRPDRHDDSGEERRFYESGLYGVTRTALFAAGISGAWQLGSVLPGTGYPWLALVQLGGGAFLAAAAMVLIAVRAQAENLGRFAGSLAIWFVCYVAAAAALCGFGPALVQWLAGGDEALRAALWVTLGPLALLGLFLAAGAGQLAIGGSLTTEPEREWSARFDALLVEGGLYWLCGMLAVVWIPWAVDRYHDSWTGAIAGLSWGSISAAGLVVAQSEWMRSASRRWLDSFLAFAALVFLLGLVALLSALAFWINAAALGVVWRAGSFLPGMIVQGLLLVPWLLAVGLAVLLIFTISANRFSLHALYLTRLVRCYLGASRAKPLWKLWAEEAGVTAVGPVGAPTGVDLVRDERLPNFFTQQDPEDDLPLAALRCVAAPDQHDALPAGYRGPLVLINAALNLTADPGLAFQDRKAASFTLSPDFCGSDLTGYAPTPYDPDAPDRLTLGRALTISGAAVDPNMGILQSAPLTALLTLLNLRLGWWLQNPSAPGEEWEAIEPDSARRIFDELRGATGIDGRYVHLSDGGHFENLGVYELVRRRCRFIVVVDAGTDRTAASDSMAAMIQLVRTDFGVPIEIDPAMMQLDQDSGCGKWHCAVGRVRYDQVDDRAIAGTIVYIQAGLTGDEPPDILQYVSRHPEFPRHSTLDQFFDAVQFECYRALGQHCAEQVFGEAAGQFRGRAASRREHQEQVRGVFRALDQRWRAPPAAAEAQWNTSCEAAMQLEQQLLAQPLLNAFHRDLYPELETRREVVELRAVGATIQVMEQAWKNMQLGEFATHPIHSGWMSTFRRWTMSPQFAQYWPILRGEFNREFGDFCEQMLSVEPGRLVASRGIDSEALAACDRQFAKEWSGAERIHAAVDEEAREAERMLAVLFEQALRDRDDEPLVWTLSLLLPDGRAIVVGVAACLAPARATLEIIDLPILDVAELFLWIKGPYRSLGHGSEAIAQLLEEFRRHALVARTAGGGAWPCTQVVSLYPASVVGAARQQMDRWLYFHFDQGFRRLRLPAAGASREYVAMAYRLWS